MKNAKLLKSIQLRGIKLRYKSWKYFSKGIAGNNSLQILKINHTSISIIQFVRLAKALYESPSIEIIDFSDDNLNDSYATMVRRIISSHSERRDEIVWSFNLRNEKPKGIAYRKGLHTLILKNNKFTERSLSEIGEVLRHDYYLLSLDMSGNKIGRNGLFELFEI